MFIGADKSVCRMQWRNLYAMRWWGPVTIPSLDATFNDIKQLIARHPEGIALLSVIAKNAGVPRSDLRKLIYEQQANIASSVLAFCCVLEGAGFWFVEAMSIITSLWVDRPKQFKDQKVIRNLDKAAGWLAPRISPSDNPITANDLRTEMDQFQKNWTQAQVRLLEAERAEAARLLVRGKGPS